MGRRTYTPSPPRHSRRRSPYSHRRKGGHGRDPDFPTSLLVRNLRHDCREEDLRRHFEKFGVLKDIYLPRDYYTGEPRGFGFVQYADPDSASEAKYYMHGQILHDRELFVVFAEENRKRPDEMRARERFRGGSRRHRRPSHRYSRSPYSRSPVPNRERSRSTSRDYHSPQRHSGKRSPRHGRHYRERSRTYSRSRSASSCDSPVRRGRESRHCSKSCSPAERTANSSPRDDRVST